VTSGLVDLTKFAARVPLHVCIVDSVFVSVAILDVRCYDNYAVAQKPALVMIPACGRAAARR